jgi:hypothetical protein
MRATKRWPQNEADSLRGNEAHRRQDWFTRGEAGKGPNASLMETRP